VGRASHCCTIMRCLLFARVYMRSASTCVVRQRGTEAHRWRELGGRGKHAGPSRTSYDVGSLDTEPDGVLRLQPVAIPAGRGSQKRLRRMELGCRGRARPQERRARELTT